MKWSHPQAGCLFLPGPMCLFLQVLGPLRPTLSDLKAPLHDQELMESTLQGARPLSLLSEPIGFCCLLLSPPQPGFLSPWIQEAALFPRHPLGKYRCQGS